ncbi:galectin-4-like [Chanos chanos]|uniref:Galectin n=1 Tax=Chanos chanos TaxID=29144 RepID=A0A6J2UP79_CHACN|nr:galectin-4-like [Chanos chanos]
MSFSGSPGYQPIYNPSVPYMSPILGCLKEGMFVYIHGVVPKDSERFHVNLKFGESADSDIAFHFNPRFRGIDRVVLNSFRNGGWEHEEVIHSMPFVQGKAFEMVIGTNSEGFQVNVNWEKFHSFPHRLPLDGVSVLEIVGDVSVHCVSIIGSVPYVGQICGGLKEGMTVFIQGTIPEEANRFYLNLECGSSKGCDIALHLSRRFEGWDKVVLNSQQNGAWEDEEKIRDALFSQSALEKGQPFGLVIIVNSEGYQINVNDEELGRFPHRVALERVSVLEIGGDVSIQAITYTGGAYSEDKLQEVKDMPVLCGMLRDMRVDRTVIIRGWVPSGTERFTVNFLTNDNEDIAFHLNPRMREGVVVRNSLIGGTWGQEERELGYMPFQEGQYFDMAICWDTKGFSVYVNGQHAFDYAHRFHTLRQIDTLEIKEGVDVSYVVF